MYLTTLGIIIAALCVIGPPLYVLIKSWFSGEFELEDEWS